MGPMRTMQQDVEFGVLQIVDIALKAVSPAVNDPSTAINCIDQLNRILIRWANRPPPASLLSDLCGARDRSVDRLRSSARHGPRPDPPLFRKRRRREFAASARAVRSCSYDRRRKDAQAVGAARTAHRQELRGAARC
jgi:Predicted membrane protein (DUF2254)